jgi:hypothetical protein
MAKALIYSESCWSQHWKQIIVLIHTKSRIHTIMLVAVKRTLDNYGLDRKKNQNPSLPQIPHPYSRWWYCTLCELRMNSNVTLNCNRIPTDPNSPSRDIARYTNPYAPYRPCRDTGILQIDCIRRTKCILNVLINEKTFSSSRDLEK